jgi:RNA polymerase sigma factor (TIGR02999 family)
MRDGSARADDLMPLVYERLRDIAGKWFRGADARATLQPTALVHEAYLRLVDQSASDWKDRAHFLAVAALAMRQIVISQARARNAIKRGRKMNRVALDGHGSPEGGTSLDDLLALDGVLQRLAKLHARHAKVVEMRFFGGLTTEEIAAALEVSTRTVELDWRAARAWLMGALSSDQ